MPHKDPEKKKESSKKSYLKLRNTPAFKKRVYENNKRFRLANIKKVKEWGRKWRLRNRDKVVSGKLKSMYGITLETYRNILSTQNGVCAICEMPEPNKRYPTLGVDHNHVTGKVRGLLCTRCNTAIGLLNESVDVIGKVITYLKKHNA